MGLNILLISLDATLAKDGESVTSNAKIRHIEYARHLESLHIVVKTSKSIKRTTRKLKDNLFIYPTSSLSRYFFFYDAYQIAIEICKENKIDLIATQDPFITGLIGWLLKNKYHIPLNIHIAADMVDNQYFLNENFFNLFLNRLAKWLLRRADTIRVLSSKQKERLVRLGMPDTKIWHIPCFINFDLFLKNGGQDIRKQYLNNKFEQLVLYAGRLVKQKDLETLIKTILLVIRQYPKAVFLIIGQGPEERRIKDLVLNSKIKDNIFFLDSVSYEKYIEFLSACDLFISTSVYEGTPLVLLEAAASGKPIVSTAHTGAYDTIIDGQTGYIVGLREPELIAQKLVYLLNNPCIAEEMGRNARQFVLSGFEKDCIIEKYIKMWQNTSDNQ